MQLQSRDPREEHSFSTRMCYRLTFIGELNIWNKQFSLLIENIIKGGGVVILKPSY